MPCCHPEALNAKGSWTTQADRRFARTRRRIPLSTHAVLYALDAQTGKELWSSGDEIKSWNHWSGISVANGRVYIGTFDGNIYSYGIKK